MDAAPRRITQPQTTAPPTIALTTDQFLTLTDGCEAPLDAGMVSDDLADRLTRVSADLRARGFSRVLPFRKPEAD